MVSHLIDITNMKKDITFIKDELRKATKAHSDMRIEMTKEQKEIIKKIEDLIDKVDNRIDSKADKKNTNAKFDLLFQRFWQIAISCIGVLVSVLILIVVNAAKIK